MIISSTMKSRAFKSYIVLLSLFALLATSVGNTFGFAWCLGDDGLSRIEKATPNGCADRKYGCADVEPSGISSIIKTDDSHCSPCSDLLIKQGSAIVSKRDAKTFKAALVARSPIAFVPVSAQQTVKSLPVTRALWVSQAILAHRTVVLLN
jgi:hypothetical protein